MSIVTKERDRRTAAPAAVLVPIYRDRDGLLRLVLIRRTDHGIHGGQIALPGGRVEPGDVSLAATALRETFEEIGVAPERIELLATLRRVRTRSSGFDIQPFLGHVRAPAAWKPQASEVAAVLTPTVASLARRQCLTRARVHPASWPEPRWVPCLRLDEHTIIWGATYRILRPLLGRLAAGHWDV